MSKNKGDEVLLAWSRWKNSIKDNNFGLPPVEDPQEKTSRKSDCPLTTFMCSIHRNILIVKGGFAP